MPDRSFARQARVVAPLMLLAGAAQALAQAAAAPADGGRALYAAHCSRCHGADATGSANAPDLRQRVRGMSEDAFRAAVLQRYRFSLPAAAAGGESGARDALLQGVLTRRDGAGEMPAWQSQPEVAAGIRQLYTFLGTPAR